MLCLNLAALALAAATFAIAGCGGSSKSDSTAAQTTTAEPTTAASTATTTTTSSTAVATQPLTTAQLITKANAFCTKVEAVRNAHTIKSTKEYGPVLAAVSAEEHAAASELEHFTAPAALTADWKLFVLENQNMANETAELSKYTAADNKKATHTVIAVAATTQQKITAVAHRDGFTLCIPPADSN